MLVAVKVLKFFIDRSLFILETFKSLASVLGLDIELLDKLAARGKQISEGFGGFEKTIQNQISPQNEQTFKPNNQVNVETKIEIKQDEKGRITSVAETSNANRSRVSTVETGNMLPVLV
jgi:hypothetical protein